MQQVLEEHPISNHSCSSERRGTSGEPAWGKEVLGSPGASLVVHGEGEGAETVDEAAEGGPPPLPLLPLGATNSFPQLWPGAISGDSTAFLSTSSHPSP